MTSILLVDDDEIVLRTLGRTLQEHFKVHTALSGEHALAVLRLHDVALVVSDYRMPAMNGLQLLDKVQRYDESIGRVPEQESSVWVWSESGVPLRWVECGTA